MNSRTDGGSDRIMALDAFKVSRHGEARAREWHVSALLPLSKALMKRAGVSVIRREGGQLLGGPNRYSANFRTLEAAHAYCSALEAFAEQERWS